MARNRVMHAHRLLSVFALALSVGCSPEIKEGHFTCEAVSDCPSEWFCWSNGRCYDTPETAGALDGSIPTSDAAVNSDASASDAAPGDAFSLDARVDTGLPPDGGPPIDGGPPGDAQVIDAGPDGGCVTTVGALCDAPGRCGARISCDGECAGGSTEPRCNCGAWVCQADGTWGGCPDPVDLGQSCSLGNVCGGTVDCMGNCSVGVPEPQCACGRATCDGAGGWICPGPANVGEVCSTMTVCDGTIDCAGVCSGGSPLPTCECGTPTCGGCVGGTCGANSTCRDGSCICNGSACSCGSAGVSSCDICLPNGNLGVCNLDAYDCGAVAPQQTSCSFGCEAGPPPVCACDPATGSSCVAETCSCPCGTFLNYGSVECDGSCTPFYPTCFDICQDICGNICPFPPCPF